MIDGAIELERAEVEAFVRRVESEHAAQDRRFGSALAAADWTLAHDGGTFRIGDSGRLILTEYRTGYAVGLYPGTFRTVELDSPSTVVDLAAGLLAAADILTASADIRLRYGSESPHVGTWIADGIVHIDPVAVLPTQYRAEAIALARAERQQAIWDFEQGREVDL